MLTEFEIRRRMADIATSADSPYTKARRLLRLRRRLRTQAASLEDAERIANQNARAHLSRMAATARLLQEDLRAEAMQVLERISKN